MSLTAGSSAFPVHVWSGTGATTAVGARKALYIGTGRVYDFSIAAGQSKELALEGLMFAYGGPMTDEDRRRHRLVSNVKGAELVYVDVQSGETKPFEGAVTDRDGRVSVSFADPDTYYISSRGGRCRYNTKLANPWLVVRVS